MDFWERFDNVNSDLDIETVPLLKEILPEDRIRTLLNMKEAAVRDALYSLLASYFRDAIDYGIEKGKRSK